MFAYHGCYLKIDVSRGTAERVPLGEDLLRQFLGGSGLGARLLLDTGAAAIDPLAPGAPLVFAFSPLVGSPLTTSAKFAVVSRSPLTERFNDSLASSGFALAGKRAGCDAIVIVGRAPYSRNARGQLIGDESGFLKLVFRRGDMRLLGVHAVGEQASELVHVGLIALMCDGGAELFNRTCFNYPTLGDLYKYATYDAMIQRMGHPALDVDVRDPSNSPDATRPGDDADALRPGSDAVRSAS